MSNLHQNVRHDLGLALVMGAFIAAWFTAALPSLRASLLTADVAASVSDTDGDGVSDVYDVK
ncbi:MAG TPA: hypothetical protein VI913_01900 [Candidatus Peribacteraceae bacterium]|nr:hypothetical protein [Candidatus Peribacteraceae bacterium]